MIRPFINDGPWTRIGLEIAALVGHDSDGSDLRARHGFDRCGVVARARQGDAEPATEPRAAAVAPARTLEAPPRVEGRGQPTALGAAFQNESEGLLSCRTRRRRRRLTGEVGTAAE